MSQGVALAESPIGPVALQWRDEGRHWRCEALRLPPHDLQAYGDQPAAQALVDDLAALRPVPARRRQSILQHAGLTDFTALVLTTLAERVPAGKVVSYGGLAELCGRPGSARAVAGVMARNRFPLLCPCHRVIAGGGTIGGFQASSAGGQQRKRQLLEAEGVRFYGRRIDPACILG